MKEIYFVKRSNLISNPGQHTDRYLNDKLSEFKWFFLPAQASEYDTYAEALKKLEEHMEDGFAYSIEKYFVVNS